MAEVLETLLDQIEQIPRERVDAEIAATRERLAKLEQIRKLTRAPAREEPTNGGEAPLEDAIFELLTAKGELTVAQIAEAMGVESRIIGRKVNSCSWFDAPGTGSARTVTIARESQAEAGSSEDAAEPLEEAAQEWLERQIIECVKNRGPHICKVVAQAISVSTRREVNEGQVYRCVFDSDKLTTMGNGKITFLSNE